MTAAKAKQAFDESMPLHERAAWMGLRDVFDKHAQSHGFLTDDMLISRMPGASEARRTLVALLRERHGQAYAAIAWMVGVSAGWCGYVVTQDRRRRGLPAGVPKMTDRDVQKRWAEIMGRPLSTNKRDLARTARVAAPTKVAKKTAKGKPPPAPAPVWEGLQNALGDAPARKGRRRAASPPDPIEATLRGVSLLGDDPEPTEEA